MIHLEDVVEGDERECETHKLMCDVLKKVVDQMPEYIQTHIPSFSGVGEVLPDLLSYNDKTGKMCDTDVLFKDIETGELYLLECKSYNNEKAKTRANIQTTDVSWALLLEHRVPVNVYNVLLDDEGMHFVHLYSNDPKDIK